MPQDRPGDVIDDYCIHCKRIMDHSVISTVGDTPAKVRCRTCQEDHDYRRGQKRLPNLGSSELGTVEPGKLADLIIVDGMPQCQIIDIQKIQTVFKGGQAFDVSGLLRLSRR
jgi:hypothetical protein